jgi:hypothetical protein
LLAAKLLLLPLAYAATAWSAFTDDRPQLEGELPKDAYSPRSYTLVLPLAFALDWWKTLFWIAKNYLPSPPGLGDMSGDHLVRLPGEPGLVATSATQPLPAAPVAKPTETLTGLAAKALDAAADALYALADQLPSRDKPGSKLGAALQAFTVQAWRTAETAAGLWPAAGSDAARYVRRWRRKQ